MLDKNDVFFWFQNILNFHGFRLFFFFFHFDEGFGRNLFFGSGCKDKLKVYLEKNYFLRGSSSNSTNDDLKIGDFGQKNEGANENGVADLLNGEKKYSRFLTRKTKKGKWDLAIANAPYNICHFN